MGLKHNTPEIIRRLRAKTAAIQPDGENLQKALSVIGNYVTTLAKMEARRQNIWDTGRLINSIRYEFFKRGSDYGIRIGSFNVKYAAIHEFGGTFTPQMRRAMFATMRETNRPPRPSKNVIRGTQFRARPFLRPAFSKSKQFMIDTLRAAVHFAATR